MFESFHLRGVSRIEKDEPLQIRIAIAAQHLQRAIKGQRYAHAHQSEHMYQRER